MQQNNNYLAIDVGEKRIGLAVATAFARLPRPLRTITNNSTTISDIQQTVADEHVGTIIVGLPFNRNDQPTDQTRYIQAFIDQLKQQIDVSVVTCDEALSSKRAEAELRKRKKPFEKGDIDALAAALILEDYLREKGEI